MIPDHEFTEATCGEPLIQFSRGSEKPVRQYAFQNLRDWISRLLSRPMIEQDLDESLEESSKPFDSASEISDIHHSKKWKDF